MVFYRIVEVTLVTTILANVTSTANEFSKLWAIPSPPQSI